MLDKETMKAHIEKAVAKSEQATAQLKAAMRKANHLAKFQDDVAHHLIAAATYASDSYYYIEKACKGF